MATTLYGTFPILLPGTTESVSRYGLKKTSGTIMFKPGQEEEARALADAKGSLFPDPQIRSTEMGLLEMSFDAYAVATFAPTGVFGTNVINLSKSFSSSTTSDGTPPITTSFNWNILEVWLVDTYTFFNTFNSSLSSNSMPIASVVLNKKKLKSIVTGSLPSGGILNLDLQVNWSNQVVSVTRRNSGLYDEVEIVTSLEGTIV